MQINSINNYLTQNNKTNPSFNAKLVIKPKALDYLIGTNPKYLQHNEYLNLFSCKYSPLKQREILYNIFRYIKKDKSHNTFEIEAELFSASPGISTRVDDEDFDFKHIDFTSWPIIRSDCICHILNFANKIYPSVNFVETSNNTILGISRITMLNKKIKNLEQKRVKTKDTVEIEKIDKEIKEIADTAYKYLEEEIKTLVNENPQKKSISSWLKCKLGIA